MTPEQFVYWLQGFVEMARPHERVTEYYDNIAWKEIKNHLDLVLTKVSPEEVMKAKTEAAKEDARQQLKQAITSLPPIPTPTVGPVVDWTKRADIIYPPNTITC